MLQVHPTAGSLLKASALTTDVDARRHPASAPWLCCRPCPSPPALLLLQLLLQLLLLPPLPHQLKPKIATIMLTAQVIMASTTAWKTGQPSALLSGFSSGSGSMA